MSNEKTADLEPKKPNAVVEALKKIDFHGANFWLFVLVGVSMIGMMIFAFGRM